VRQSLATHAQSTQDPEQSQLAQGVPQSPKVQMPSQLAQGHIPGQSFGQALQSVSIEQLPSHGHSVGEHCEGHIVQSNGT
jgi:hypothetical protein